MSTNGKTQEQKTYQALLERVRALLAKWQSSGVDVFLALREIEREGTWKLGMHHTFQSFLTREFPDVIGIHQYNHVIRAIEEYGEDFVRTVGISSSHALIPHEVVSKPERKAEIKAAVMHHVSKDGCAPGLPKIREIVRSVAPETRKPCQEVQAVRQQAREQTEIARLRARVAELETENAELKKEIERLNRLLHPGAAPAKQSAEVRIDA